MMGKGPEHRSTALGVSGVRRRGPWGPPGPARLPWGFLIPTPPSLGQGAPLEAGPSQVPDAGRPAPTSRGAARHGARVLGLLRLGRAKPPVGRAEKCPPRPLRAALLCVRQLAALGVAVVAVRVVLPDFLGEECDFRAIPAPQTVCFGNVRRPRGQVRKGVLSPR